ncbi:MAG: YbaY family lipoprotein [Aeromicrobium erythreum]
MTALLTVTGTVGIREKAEVPADAVLSIKLVSNDGEVLAGTALAAQPETTPFELVVDAVLAPKPEQLRLWAMLRTDDGVWGTPELVTVRDEVWLTRVDR